MHLAGQTSKDDVLERDHRAEILADRRAARHGGVGHQRLRIARLRDVVVEQHGDQHHRAHEQLEPVGVDAGVEDAHLHEAEDQRAEHARRSPSRSRRSAGMPPITAAMIASNSFWVPRSVSAEPVDEHLDRGEQRRRAGGADEQDDLDPRDRHADIARRVRHRRRWRRSSCRSGCASSTQVADQR